MEQSENLPSPTPQGKAAPKKVRGKPSSNRRMETFLDKKNNEFAQQRRNRVNDSLGDALLQAFDAYKAQTQHGNDTSTLVPVTTRGIGLHCLTMVEEANKHLPRVEQPTKADVNQLYRYSLMQLGREMSITEPGPAHTRADIIPRRDKVSAFSAHTNGVHIADAINQYGNFEYKDRKFTTYVPDLQLSTYEEFETDKETSPDYHPQSPDPSNSPEKRKKVVQRRLVTMPSPYCVTIFNLRNVVQTLSNPSIPLVIRNQFITRNPIPGAKFVDGLLTNPNEIMPVDYSNYIRNLFPRDVASCNAFFDQISLTCPGSIGRVAMDGRGSELNLASVYTIPSATFHINNYEILCNSESHNFATDSLNNIARLRAYVNLMNEAPILYGYEEMTSRFGIRDPNSSQHSMIEYWTALAWNTSVFRKRVA